jgi:chromosome segregation ATPase
MPEPLNSNLPNLKISIRLLIAVTITSSLLLISCDSSKLKELQAENDSLKHQLNSGEQMVGALVKVNTLLDSIDATRHMMRVNSANGSMGPASYSQRMGELKEYIKQTEDKIGELEATLVETNVNSESYLVIISALKDELRIRNEELGLIEENSELNNEVMLKGVQLEDIEARLEVKKTELKLLELQIKELVKRMNISEAEGLYAQAGAMEEAARRTKLAPFKRRQTYREALALYEQSLAKGKKEAKAKVDELKAKVGPDDND